MMHSTLASSFESCALTLALKYKLRTMRKTFKRFGKELECPVTGLKLKLPDTLRVQHDYKNNVDKEDLEEVLRRVRV